MIQMSKIDHYDGEELLFCKKTHIKTQGKKKDVQNLYHCKNEEFQFI